MMPDREKTRPWLEHQIRHAEVEVAAARMVARVIGDKALKDALAGLATAGTVLALADAEWAREEAASPKQQRPPP